VTASHLVFSAIGVAEITCDIHGVKKFG
jgi:hypothetical protein